MSNRGFRVFTVFISVATALGILIGYELSTFPRLETHKLVNIVGLLYSLLGVVVLSEMAAVSSGWKKIAVEWVAPAVLWVHTVLPLGIFLGGLATAIFLRGTLGSRVAQFSLVFFFYSLIPLLLLNETVVFPQFAALRALEFRWRWFALFLLMMGIALQLIAALMAM